MKIPSTVLDVMKLGLGGVMLASVGCAAQSPQAKTPVVTPARVSVPEPELVAPVATTTPTPPPVAPAVVTPHPRITMDGCPACGMG